MHEKQFPVELQNKIQDQVQFNWTKSQGMDESSVFNELPRVVRQEIANFLYANLVDAVPLFKDADAAFKNGITMALKSVTVLTGQYIFNAGDDGQEMYFIKKVRC
jgi:hypothetical protein